MAQAFQPGDLHLQSRRQNAAARRAHHRHGVLVLCACGRVPGWRRLVGGSGWGWCAFGLLCLFAALCFVCLLGLLLCACFRFSLPLLGFFTLLQLAPCFGSCLASRGQPLCPWDWGDKVVSSCWWVRACFIHPETLFQTLSQVIGRRIRPRLAPRTPF